MAQNSEQIEAKLCAYLEGELDEQGRAEIEKHLQANPAHRKLLAEVAGTRDLLRALPRESAPADLCETLQGHLERSVLLGDTADAQADTAMRIGRWRPVFAIAAMVVLAVGLGLVIYFGLPSAAQRQAHSYVNNAPAMGPMPGGGSATLTPLPETPEAVAATQDTFLDDGAPGRRGMSIASDAASGPSTPSTTGPVVALSATGDDDAAPESLRSLAQRVPKLWSPEQQRALFRARGRNGDAAGSPAGPAVYLVLSTSAPAAAREEVERELDKLQVAWETVPAALALATRDESGLNFPKTPGGFAEKRDAAAGAPPEAAAGARPGPAPAATGPADEPVAQAGGTPEGRRPQSFSKADSSPAPATGAAAAPPAPGPTPRDSVASASPAPASEPAPAAAAPAAANDSAPAMILARNVTRRQAELLCTTLGRADQQVALWAAQDGATFAPVKQEVAQGSADARHDVADATQPVVRARTGGDDGVRTKVALRDSKDLDVQEHAFGQSGAGAGGALGAGRGGAGGGAAGAAPARTRAADGASLRRNAQPGSAARSIEPGRGLESDRAADAQAKAKEDAAAGTPEKKAGIAPVAAPKGPAVADANNGRSAAVGESESAETDPLAAGDAPAAGADQEAAPPAPEARGADSRPATRYAAASAANEEDRIDLVIVVRSPDAAGGPPGIEAQPAAPARPGPIEKFEILTVTVGEADAVNVRVGEDGSIDLPPAGRIAAEGLTAEALGKRIAEALGKTNPDVKVTVSRPDDGGAATQPEAKGDGAQPQPRNAGDDASAPQDPPTPPPAATSPAASQQ